MMMRWIVWMPVCLLLWLPCPEADEVDSLNRQLAFAGSIGFDLRIAGHVFVGLRCDSLLGDDLVRVNFAAFAGYRY